MCALTKAQRAGILERLKHNHKYAIVVSCAKAFRQKDALEFASKGVVEDCDEDERADFGDLVRGGL